MTRAHDFLLDEFFTLTLLGALGRATLWKDGVLESNRKQFHGCLRNRLVALAADYRETVSDAEHLTNICALAAGLSADYAPLFRDGRFRIGLAQKALNLYLKYLWCADFAAKPPHCPVDRFIQEHAKLKPIVNWTELDSIEEYARLIERLRAVADARPLADWELEAWSAQKEKAALLRRTRCTPRSSG